MLELTSKWVTNTLAKQSMLTNDFIMCENGLHLYIVGFGTLTSSGKNTYNYQLKDSEGVVLSEEKDAYLDKLTTLIKGTSPKSKKSSNNQNSENMKANKGTLVSEFIKLRDNLKKATIAFSDFQASHNVITLEDVAKLDEANNKNKVELDALHKTLEIAQASGNTTLIASIEAMIKAKEVKEAK